MRKCTCRGGNPVCAFCGGWGEIPGKPIKANTPPKIPKPSLVHIICPYCQKLVKFSILDNHVREIHNDKWDKYIADSIFRPEL